MTELAIEMIMADRWLQEWRTKLPRYRARIVLKRRLRCQRQQDSIELHHSQMFRWPIEADLLSS